ncbi:YncE family protein [Clostridium tyrobutyricum]|uniref:YncE family protein n=1 Tax=Clostridium tyrobutyricum TaxID=1519 RepID=UPI002B1FEBAB|nr:YncE family protein [Clostridium tyrobutyricum]MEA5009041.1 YncE family protein [Clostridium tyrobutyricum]
MLNSKRKKIIALSALSVGLFTVFSSLPAEAVKPETAVQKTFKDAGREVDSYYYTANEGGSVSKIDAQTNKVVRTFMVDGTAHNVQISPDGKILGVTVAAAMEKTSEDDMSMNMNGYAWFYDTETDELISKVMVGEHPAHIVFTPNGKYAVVTNNKDNNLSIIDMNTYKVIKQVSTGNGPHGFRISKDGKYAYVANIGEDSVSVIDLVIYTEIKKIKVGKTPVTTAITSNGKTLVSTANAEKLLAIVDIASGNISKVSVGIGPAQVYISPDDRYAFVANQGTEESPSNTVSKVDLSTKKVVATIKVGNGAHGVVTSSDNKYVYITNMYENTVSVIENASNKVIATVPVGKEPNGITYKK